MLRKSQEEQKQSTNRNKLPQEEDIRSLAGIKELLAMAKASRGSQIELEWTTKNPGQIFVLDVQWDANMDEPFWSLYETGAGRSKPLFSQPFNPNDIEMFYDVLVMSCGAVSPTSKLSDILKPQPGKEDWSKSSESKIDNKVDSKSSPTPETVAQPESAPAASPEPIPTPEPVPSPANQAPGPNPGYAPPYGFPPGMPVPINPAIGFPMPAYNVPPNMQGMPLPMAYPPNINPANLNQVNPGFPGAPGMQNLGWQYAPATGGNINPFGQPSIDPSNPPAPGTLSSLPIDASLVNKQNDIGLVDLLIKAQLLTEPTLEAALKIQDLIESNKINIEKASEILKRYHSKGKTIENYINSPIDSAIDSAMASAKASSGAFSTLQKTPGQENISQEVKAKQEAKTKLEDKATSAAFELLQKAGLLSQDDIKTAQGVSRKHGGDIVSILEAANKIDKNTLEAAKICQALEKEESIKLEQCVIVLNYCIRSRVSFDEAISELGWPNPRHLKK